MKIVHTSDLHLGGSLYGHDRSAEQAAMLDAIIELCARHRPDAVLISGDIFDVASPSAAIQTLFVEKVEQLRRRCPQCCIVITAGNHDSGAHHEIFRTAWQSHNIHLVGTVRPSDDEQLGKLIIEVPGKGLVAAVPYLRDSKATADIYGRILKECESLNTAGLPVVLMAHTAVAGSDFGANTTDTEGNRDYVGNIAVRPLNDLGQGYDYLALGHIHRPQTLQGARARYCGTPLPMSFDEIHKPSATIVEIDSHSAMPRISVEALEGSFRGLRTIPTEGSTTFEHALELLELLPPHCNDYIRLNICQDEPPGRAGDMAARMALEHTQAIYCHCNYIPPARAAENDAAGISLSVEQMQQRHPASIAADYARSRGVDFDELRDLFDIACNDVENDIE